jgi:hypothetical protein
MNVNPELRLGANNFNEIKMHPFFKNINWDYVIDKKYIPPIIPKNSIVFTFSNKIKKKNYF